MTTIIYTLTNKDKAELYADAMNYNSDGKPTIDFLNDPNIENHSICTKKEFLDSDIRYIVDFTTEDAYLEIDGSRIEDDYSGTLEYIQDRTQKINFEEY